VELKMFRFFLNGSLKETNNNLNETGGSSSSSSLLKDRVLIGSIAGALGLLTRDVYSFFAKQIGFAKFYVWGITADLFMEKKFVQSFFGYVVGFLGDIVFGATIGIVFLYFIKYTNTKNFLIKSWGIGMAAWLLLFGILLHTLPGSETSAPKDALSNFSAFFGHSVFGLSMGIYAQIMLKKYDLLQ
jgi:uncharacterized membrane protein YagU involved in acid resistance